MNSQVARLLFNTLLLVSALGLASGCNPAKANSTELYWVARGADKDIMLSRLESDRWSSPESVYNTENPVTSLALVTDQKGVTTLIWTERFKAHAALMSMRRNSLSGEWSRAELFSDFGQENYATSMVVDRANRIWLFWAANHGDLDDIFLIQSTASGWSEPLMVNAPNTVPDIRPKASLNLHGDVIVEWQSYSFDAGEYLTLFREFEVDKSPESLYKSLPDGTTEMALDDLALPAFLPENATAVVHFANNRLQQTETLKNRLKRSP